MIKAPWLLLLVSTSLAAQNWVPTFEDDFNGTQLDLSRWIPHDPHDATHSDPETVTVSDGQLHLAARKLIPATVSTYGMFAQTYGRFEIRLHAAARLVKVMLLPVPEGTLPAIDIFNSRRATGDNVYLGNHWGTEQTERSYGDSFTLPEFSQAFHTIALEWERGRITWFLDGKKTFESTDGVPGEPMYLSIGLAADSEPSSLDVDYVRIYKRAGQ